MLKRASIVAVAAAFVPAPAVAQEVIYRSSQVASGQTIRLGLFGNMRPDCTAGPAPEVKVTSHPKSGLLKVSAGKLKTNLRGKCPQIEVPVNGVFYQANPRFVGQDEITFEVTSASGKKVSQSIKITVTAAPAARPRDLDPTEL